jgi:hypothetical protein
LFAADANALAHQFGAGHFDFSNRAMSQNGTRYFRPAKRAALHPGV